MKFTTTTLTGIALIGAGLFYVGQVGSVNGASFGFEKNASKRNSADAESVAGCMQSCENMLAGWISMNPDSPNYSRQREKIEAKAAQCLAMNALAGSPFSEENILLSCGLRSECVEIPPDMSVDSGACGNVALIGELHLPQCCTTERPRGIDCGVDAEWVVGVAAFPVCYIPHS